MTAAERLTSARTAVWLLMVLGGAAVVLLLGASAASGAAADTGPPVGERNRPHASPIPAHAANGLSNDAAHVAPDRAANGASRAAGDPVAGQPGARLGRPVATRSTAAATDPNDPNGQVGQVGEDTAALPGRASDPSDQQADRQHGAARDRVTPEPGTNGVTDTSTGESTGRSTGEVIGQLSDRASHRGLDGAGEAVADATTERVVKPTRTMLDRVGSTAAAEATDATDVVSDAADTADSVVRRVEQISAVEPPAVPELGPRPDLRRLPGPVLPLPPVGQTESPAQEQVDGRDFPESSMRGVTSPRDAQPSPSAAAATHAAGEHRTQTTTVASATPRMPTMPTMPGVPTLPGVPQPMYSVDTLLAAGTSGGMSGGGPTGSHPQSEAVAADGFAPKLVGLGVVGHRDDTVSPGGAQRPGFSPD